MSDIVLDKSYIENLMNQMTEDQKIQALAKFMGYGKVPPSIEEFIINDYYLGKVFNPKLPNGLYPYWLKILKKIFPNPIQCRYPFVSLGGAIGTGKSTVSKIIALYNLCKLDHMDDPWRSLGISRTKDIAFTFIHNNADVANKEFIQSLKEIMEQSPYFCNPIHNLKHFRFQAEGTRNTKSLGTDTIFYVLSEVNFWKPAWIGKEKMDTALGRYTSRFLKWEHFNGGIIFDTSAKGDAAVMEKFVRENALGDKLLTVRASQWEVKGKERGGFFIKGGFWVYAGDSLKNPFILNEGETPDSLADMNYDKDRFIYAPQELYAEFKSDIVKALNDKAGYSTHSTGKFFEDVSAITRSVKYPKLNDDVVMVNFYDTEDKLIYKIEDSVKKLDKTMPCYIHIDMGYVHDLCGISIIQFKEWYYIDEENDIKYPSFIAPVCVGISRFAGQETSALHIFDLIMEISKMYDLASVSYDHHQTRPIVQELIRANIDTRYVSVDRTTEPYIVLKNLMSRQLVDIPQNDVLIKELSELQYVGPDKVDHPACFTGDTRVKVIHKRDHTLCTVSMKDLVNCSNEYLAYCYDVANHKVSLASINAAFKTKEVNELTHIKLSDGYEFSCTPDHRILTPSGYVEASRLKLGEKVVNIRREVIVISNQLMYQDLTPVYDLTVEPYHNFILENGIVVHNSGGKDIADSLCGAIFNAYSNIETASEPGTSNTKVKNQIRLLNMASAEEDKTKDFLLDKAINLFR